MNTATKMKNRKLSHLALALALSAGTIGGMMTFAATTEPAFAQAAAGGGGRGGGTNGGGGGGDEDVMNPNGPMTHARNPNRTPPVVQLPRPQRDCQHTTDGRDIKNCRYTQRSTPRIVSINGFANCAVVRQDAYGQFYCARLM